MGDAQQFFRTHPVFTLDQFRRAVGGRATAAKRTSRPAGRTDGGETDPAR
jgi:hypothetical protein